MLSWLLPPCVAVCGASASSKEQKKLSEKIKKCRAGIDKQSSQSITTGMFISLLPLPAPEVSVNKRKGVVVNYALFNIRRMRTKKGEWSYSFSNAVRTLAMVQLSNPNPNLFSPHPAPISGHQK